MIMSGDAYLGQKNVLRWLRAQSAPVQPAGSIDPIVAAFLAKTVDEFARHLALLEWKTGV
jgi:hypothetical protein